MAGLVTKREAADLIGVGIGWLERQAAAGRIRPAAREKRGRHWLALYRPADVLAVPRPRVLVERFHAAPCPEPTDAMPGTPDKIAVLAARAAAGVALWHPLDRTGAEDARAAGRGVRKAVRA